MTYRVQARDYLERAKSLLSDGSSSSLYYAAFELRCGFEARMNEYLDVQKHISAKKKRGWQVSKIAQNIEDAFRIGEKSAIIRIVDRNDPDLILDMRYTPVRKNGRKIAEKLGNYLHRSTRYNAPEDQYWDNFRELLKDGVAELEYSTSGMLLGPPLHNPKTKQADLKVDVTDKSAEPMLSLFNSMSEIDLHVRYE
ncbi:hypothetical protein RCQ53_005153 [Vibrio harveyi]|nr:hypothetical protein [Vibrio harveyi]